MDISHWTGDVELKEAQINSPSMLRLLRLNDRVCHLERDFLVLLELYT